MAVRRVAEGPVEVLPDAIADGLIKAGTAFPANGRAPEPESMGVPEIDDGVEVHGLTDREPDFFEKQGRDKAMADAPIDRMFRGKHRNGR